MEENELKTSKGQRIGILLIAIIMLGSVIAGYVAIVASGSGGAKTGDTVSEITEEKKKEYEQAYVAKSAEFKQATGEDFAVFKNYLGEVHAYDEEAANAGDVTVKELSEGDGKELVKGDRNYLAYYVGWCANGEVFDSSLDDVENPTMFIRALDASYGSIPGWEEGVIGMKLGGVRRITMSGEKAYGETREICGGLNKPLRFLVMVIENTDEMSKLSEEMTMAKLRLDYAEYGIDYGE